MNLVDKYNTRAAAVDSLLCIGLDSDFARLPEEFIHYEFPLFIFNRWIIEQTHEYASAYKMNMAFYEARGDRGISSLRMTMEYLQQEHPDIPTICDAKRADVPSTSEAYARAVFDWFGFDAVTLNPYLGKDALQPFLKRADKGCIILCRTSNPGAGEIQDLPVNGTPLWQVVAETVYKDWNTNQNCMLVVGATYPEELKQVRQMVGDMTLLVPGLGTQGGDVAQTVRAGLREDGSGLILNASRSVIFSESPAQAARQLRDEINRYRTA
ncbi:MAG: orotidine-5'-phosphate decarboxylase [Anaerolineae bacterium]|nr:orotidine-5'-phosphate decarboxylase [Anaerolineae bacterium]